MYAVPVFAAVYWLTVDTQTVAAELVGIGSTITELSPLSRLGGLFLMMIPLSALIFCLHSLRRLFRLYANGTLFEAANVTAFRRLGFGLVVMAAAQVITVPLMSVFFSWNNPPGKRALTLEISSDMVTIAIIGCVVVIIARVMDEARQIHEEQSLTV